MEKAYWITQYVPQTPIPEYLKYAPRGKAGRAEGQGMYFYKPRKDPATGLRLITGNGCKFHPNCFTCPLDLDNGDECRAEWVYPDKPGHRGKEVNI